MAKIIHLHRKKKCMMESKEVRGIEEALEVLKKYRIDWATVNKIENSLWETGVAFFNRNFRRIAYYDEVHNVLLIDRIQILRHTIKFNAEIEAFEYLWQASEPRCIRKNLSINERMGA